MTVADVHASDRVEHQALAPLLRLVVFVCVAVFAIGVWIAFVDHISPILHFQGEVDLQPDPSITALGIAMALFPSLLMPIRATQAGVVVAWLFYLLVYVPSAIIPFHSTDYQASGYLMYVMALMVCAVSLAWLSSLRLRLFDRARFGLSEPVFLILLLGATGLSMAYIYNAVGLSLSLTADIDQLYELRSVLQDRLFAERLFGVGYLMQIVPNALLPLLTGIALYSRRWSLLALTLLGQVLLFGATTQKSPAAVFILQLLLYFIMQRGTAAIIVLCLVATVGTWAVIAADSLFDVPELVFMTVRRAVTTNGLLSGYYFDYFSRGQDFAYYSQTIFGAGIDTAGASYKLIIGSAYLEAENSANVNFWADAYANLGFPGVFLVTLVLAALLIAINGLLPPAQAGFGVVVLGGAVQSLANTGLQTVVVSGGLLFLLILLYLIPRSLYGGDQPVSTPAA